jgi:hypothetical protein
VATPPARARGEQNLLAPPCNGETGARIAAPG